MRLDRYPERTTHSVGRNCTRTDSLARALAVTCVLGVLGAACAGDSDGFEPGAPIPSDNASSTAGGTLPPTRIETPPSTDTATSSTSTTSPSTTSLVDTSTTDVPDATTPPPSTTEPEADIAQTPQAPGFDFPPAELETDPASPNNNRALDREDQPIIDAYLNAFEADMATFSKWPLDPESPELLASPITDEVLSLYEDGIARRTELNQVLDISGGLTSRPYVIEDDDGDPDRAIVWDCQVDATFWKDVDTGEKAPPDAYPNVGPPGVEFGWASALVFEDGEWLVAEGGEEPRACR